jgi:predicted permease
LIELLRRIHYLLNRGRFDQELADEMAFHREMAAREGGAPFGNTLRLREEAREAWGWMSIDRIGQDLRYAARMLRRSPGFTAAAVLMLAIGIGANVAAFGFFNLVVFRPLPVRDPDTILRFERRGPKDFWSDLPYPAMVFYREHATRTLSAVLALNPARVTLEGEEKPAAAHFVTANFFAELGARAELGRVLDAGDETQGAPPVVVLGHGFWQSHFGADPLVVGRPLRVNGKTATVIGVASAEFSGLGQDTPAVWLPVTQHPYFVHGSRLLTDFSAGLSSGVDVWGRLRPGVTPEMAEAELSALAAELRRQHPQDVWEGERLVSRPGGYAQSAGLRSRGTDAPPSLRTRLFPVFALIGTLVLLILTVACSNLGGLLLARGVAREREVAVRIAVGAGPGRLVRQLLTESLLLALLGAVAGFALGHVLLRSMMAWTGAPIWLDAGPDWRVVAFAVVIGFAAAILFGLAPALQIARRRHRATFSRSFLIGAQVAASSVLLIVAGLLVRALDHATSADPGFEYRRMVAIDPGLSAHGYSPASARAYLDTLLSRLRGLPGIESVALSSTPPLGGSKIVSILEVDGRRFDAYIHQVDPGFLDTLRIPLLRGRNLVAGDTQAIVVSESLARRQWPGQDPLGKPLALGVDSAGRPASFTVVGTSASARSLALQDPDAVEIYRLASEADLAWITVVARTSGPPEAVAASLAAVANAVDPTVAPRLQLLKSAFGQKVQAVERSALAVSVLGAIALLVACLGIVGLVAYSVSERTKEIGIRMALGARPAHILRVVLRQLERTVAVGLLVGAGGGAALSRLLRGELYGISALDPVAYLVPVVVFVVAAALAALGPARRALGVDPMRALRCD